MPVQKETKIGEIVAHNYRSAQVFERYGVDFCCGGKKTISEACSAKGINADNVISELKEINGAENHSSSHFNTWKLDFLIDYIVNNHHRYVDKMLPVIYMHSQKVAEKHGANHNETLEIAELFTSIKNELEVHMQKEERMLFPYIKHMLKMEQSGEEVPFPPFGSVENPVRMMELEHEAAGKQVEQINLLSSNYLPPEDGCTTYRVLYQELKEFENDLHMHIHLENNILFPRAVELEKKLTANKSIIN
jgi:regulator of cell morphogenesis and NO signaling